jgi:hypothetical protein
VIVCLSSTHSLIFVMAMEGRRKVRVDGLKRLRGKIRYNLAVLRTVGTSDGLAAEGPSFKSRYCD